MTEEAPAFEPYRMPEHIDMKLERKSEGFKAIYHILALGYWAVKRDRANDKMRKHGTYFEHETEVTRFKRQLNGED